MTEPEGADGNDTQVYVTMLLADQLCGIPALAVRDILGPQPTTRIPLAPPEVAGSLNLRGRIVTAVDLRRRLRLPPRPDGEAGMAVVTEQGSDLYALLVDQVDAVITLRPGQVEATPPTLPAVWAAHCAGVARIDAGLMLLLDCDSLLALGA